MLPNVNKYRELIERKERLEHELVDIGLHAKGISEYMFTVGYEHWSNLSQWFHIGHGLKELSYDGITYDNALFMCRPAYEYEVERQELYHRLVREITLFSYLYSGLEGVLSSLKTSPCPTRKGKINAACYYLQASFPKWSAPISHYCSATRLCETLYQHSFDGKYSLANELNECVSIHGLGLRLLYKIRNAIMHGDFFFPEPLEHSVTLPFQPEIINLCSRLVLMTVQMLFIAYRNDNYIEELQIYNSSIIPEREEEWFPHEKNYLLSLHLKSSDHRAEQLEITFS